MKQKLVIKVPMNGQKSRSKAMKIAVGFSGVESAALQGQDMTEIEITGDGVDAVALTRSLRKSVGYAELVSVAAADKKEEEKKSEATVQLPWTWTSYPPYPMVYEYRDSSDPNCSIM